MNEGLKKKISLTAMAVSAGMVLGMTSALAADLGGNCCADLEERVAELEATTVKKGTRKTSVELWGLVNQANTFWDDGARSNAAIGYGNHTLQTRFGIRGSAKIGGEYSAGYSLVIDIADKARTSTFGQTNDTGGSKLGIRNDDYAIRLRDANWWIESARLGRFTTGRITNEVATGTPDMGGISHAVGDSAGCNGGGLRFRNSAAPGTLGASIGQYTDGGCAGPWANRLQGIKWQSPTLAGFQFLAAYGPNISRENTLETVGVLATGAANTARANFGTEWGIGARYAGEFNGVRIAANAGYQVDDLTREQTDYIDSAGGTSGRSKLGNIGAGLMHVPTGLFIQGEYSGIKYEVQDNNNAGALQPGRNASRWHLQGGITRNWFGIGNTSFYGEYMRSENFFFALNSFGVGGLPGGQTVGGTIAAPAFNLNTSTAISGDKISTWGIGANQKIDAAAMDLYINYRNHKVSDPNSTASYKDISVVTTGAIIRF
jgi:hypothetical protein